MAVYRRAAARRDNVLSRVAATEDVRFCVMRNTFSTKIGQKIHFDLEKPLC